MRLVIREITTSTLQLNLYTEEEWIDRQHINTGMQVSGLDEAIRNVTGGRTFNLYQNVNKDSEYILIRY